MTFFGDEQVRKVRDAVDLVDLLGDYTKVVKSGAGFVACCPVHGEKTPSLHVYPDEGRAYCYGACKKNYDAIDLVCAKEGVDFQGAVELLARRVGIKLEVQGGPAAKASSDKKASLQAIMSWAVAWFSDRLWQDADAQPALAYLRGRGFTDDTLREFGLGWAPGRCRMLDAAKAAGFAVGQLIELDLVMNRDGRSSDRFFDRIIIPICDRRGHPVGITARLLPEAEKRLKDEGKSVGKYINSTRTPLYEKGLVVFNLHRGGPAARRSGRIFVLEGPLDVMAAHQAERPEVVATLGTALTPDHAASVRRAVGEDTQVVIALDGDHAGRTASASAVVTLLHAGVLPAEAVVSGGKDLAAILEDRDGEITARAGDLGIPRWLRITLDASCDVALADGQAPPWLRSLLAAAGVDDDTTDQARLAAATRLCTVLAGMPSRDLAELQLQLVAEALALPLKMVRSAWKDATAEAATKPVAGEGSPPAPGGGQDGDYDYKPMVESLTTYVGGLGSRPDAMCGWITADGGPADLSDNDVMMRFAHAERMRNRTIIDHKLKSAATVLIGDWRNQRRAELLGTILGRPATEAGLASLRQWVKGATGHERPLDIAVMRHFIWQVKRMAAGRDADWHIIPVLFGGQGLGKTIAMERLCRPLHELSFTIDASSITDERKSLVLTRALIGRLDEMAGMQKADAEKLKAIATAKHMMFRELYTMSVQQRLRVCSFIASSNLPLDAIIKDPTGVRRFYQIHCVSKDWDLINSLDPAVLWQCASEDDEAPIREHLGELRSQQQLMVHHDVVALWMRCDDWRELEILRSDSKAPIVVKMYDPSLGYRLEDLVTRLKYWATGKGQSAPTLPVLRTRLLQEGVIHKRVYLSGSSNDARAHRWFIPPKFLPGLGGDDRLADLDLAEDLTTAAAGTDFP